MFRSRLDISGTKYNFKLILMSDNAFEFENKYVINPVDLAWIYEPRHEISNNVVCANSKASNQPAHTHSLIRVPYSVTV